IDRVKNLLQSTAQLEFWHVYKSTELQNFMVQANNVLKDMVVAKEAVEAETEVDTTEAAEDEIDALLASAEDTTEVTAGQQNPLFDLIVSPGFQGGPVLATFSVQDTAKVNDYLN